MSLREVALKKRGPKRETITIPEWDNAEVIVQAMTPHERAQFQLEGLNKDGKPIAAKARITLERIVVASVVDADGNKTFTAADIPALSEQPVTALDAIADVAKRLSGLDDSDKNESLLGNGTSPAASSG